MEGELRISTIIFHILNVQVAFVNNHPFLLRWIDSVR